jgi:hypothetical protein
VILKDHPHLAHINTSQQQELWQVIKRLPAVVIVSRAVAAGLAKLQFENRMNLPVVDSRELLAEKVFRVEH